MPSKSPLDAPYTAAECKQQLRRTVIASSADTSSSPSSVRMLSAMPGKHNSRSGLGFSETPCMESFKLFKPCSTNVATPRRLPVVLRLLDIEMRFESMLEIYNDACGLIRNTKWDREGAIMKLLGNHLNLAFTLQIFKLLGNSGIVNDEHFG
eukprot:CAMPEP_0201930344 /NCGR_PEP_ID=MMETSP0903-20130614/24978_1 /ASSEMBLY_ACC=CAM_ASM_000552 /TAXON_ID=420261 /ORGANISM="Thalassiosira antarctica, Strain CCMP982" /LENGTH=151 /DNA_ID=CAMNT_0048469387 /DNA_START=293 /DNA_END=749 /DNA_ORIENTATION=-